MLEGVVIGLLFTTATGVLTFALHQRLPYKRLLIVTGAMLLFVLPERTADIAVADPNTPVAA